MNQDKRWLRGLSTKMLKSWSDSDDNYKIPVDRELQRRNSRRKKVVD